MKPLLLVVENDSGTRRLLEVFLRRESFDVDAVATGSDALLLLERVDYSAVVLDLLIPGRTGRDVLADVAARRSELLERIVVISSATETHLRDVRGRHPAVAVLRKPFDLLELLATVTERVGRHVIRRTPDPSAAFVRRSIAAGAKTGVVVRRSSDALELASAFGYEAGVAEKYFPLAADAQLPLSAVFRSGRPVWMPALSLTAAEFPLLVPLWKEYGSYALAAVPVFAEGRAMGVVGWTFGEPRLFDASEQAQFTAIAAETAAELIGSPRTTALSRHA